MVNVMFSGKSEADLSLLIALAQKIGIKTQVLDEDELEDIGLGLKMKKAKTGEYVDTHEFLNKLKSKHFAFDNWSNSTFHLI